MSVGGGDIKKKISINLIEVAKYAKKNNIKMISTIGRKNSFLGKNTLNISFDVKEKFFLTPISETLQVFVWHYLVSLPALKKNKTKW